MGKQEMRDKMDGQTPVSSRVPTISFKLGVVSLVMIGLNVPMIMTFLPVFVSIALLLDIGATVIGGVGLVLGLIGIQPIYVKRGSAIRPIYVQRGRAVKGIILCAVSIIMGIGATSFCVYLFER